MGETYTLSVGKEEVTTEEQMDWARFIYEWSHMIAKMDVLNQWPMSTKVIDECLRRKCQSLRGYFAQQKEAGPAQGGPEMLKIAQGW